MATLHDFNFAAHRRPQEALRPISETIQSNFLQTTLPVRLRRVQHWDDSQATAISETELEPAAVTSPLSEWYFDYEDFENLPPGEASDTADHPIAGADTRYVVADHLHTPALPNITPISSAWATTRSTPHSPNIDSHLNF